LNRQGFYITLINTFIGIGASLLLKDNLLIALLLSFLVMGTIIFIERKWLDEKIFRKNKWYAIAGYSVLAVTLIIGLSFLTKPGRETSHIITSINIFLNDIKKGDYKGAYEQLSQASKNTYPLNDFTRDHSNNRLSIQDFTIDQVIFNKYDDKKTVAMISSPFLLYGHETLHLEMIKEDHQWRVVFSRNIVTGQDSASLKSRKRDGVVTSLFKKLF
jgi:hypothetical protein